MSNYIKDALPVEKMKGVILLSGAHCLKDHVYKHLSPCRVLLQFESASTDAYFSINLGDENNSFVGSAYFPPRLRLKVQEANWTGPYIVNSGSVDKISWDSGGGTNTPNPKFCTAPSDSVLILFKREKARGIPVTVFGATGAPRPK